MSKRGERLRKGVTQHIEGEPGELGRLESTGAYTVPTGQLNEVYVRLNGDPNNLVTAIDLVTNRKARLPVLVRKTPSNTYKVIGTDPLKINQFLGVDAPAAGLPPVRGSTVNAVWESYQLNPGRVRALNGSDLQVYMEPLPYGNGDLGGVSGNMATVVGTITSGKKAWIAIAVDPTTNVLSFTKGTEYALPVPIGTRAFATAVAVPDGEIPLWAYLIRAGATYVPVQPTSPDSLFFVDRRAWLQLPQTIGDVDAVHVNIAGEIAGLTRKVSPVSADKVIIEDSADSNSKKYVEIGDLPGSGSGSTITADEYASRPAAGNTGDVFLPFDSVDFERDNGVAFDSWGPLFAMTDPPASGWAWDNQTTSTDAAFNNKRYLKAVGTAGSGVTLRYRTMPTAPYVLTVGMIGVTNNTLASNGPSIFVRASDGKLIEFRYLFGESIGLHKWTDSVNYSAAYKNLTGGHFILAPMVWLRIEDNNTNLIFSLSADSQNFLEFYSVSRTDFLTPAQVGWGVEVSAASGSEIGITLLSWEAA